MLFFETAFAQAAKDSKVNVAVNMNPLDAIFAASIVVQVTLLILVGMSIVCWAVFLAKRKQLAESTEANEPFLDEFWRAKSLDSVYDRLPQFPDSSMARIFRAGYMELRRMSESPLMSQKGDQLSLAGIDNLERAVRKEIDLEVQRLESRLTWLATTGSTGPFIGLFGTVWGIMGAFHKIGTTGAASLAVVAPGISEALVATAIGLAAAIPAVMVYNYFIGRVRRVEIELNNFAADFLNVTKRNFFRD
jgi:biopolymer transport protein TolQ